MNKRDLRIVYMGTPDFAVEPLKKLFENNYNIVGVVTNYDKPAGRGQKIQESAVKIYAKDNNLKILQPHKFRDEEFLNDLKSLNADLQIVVAFKMLPEIVWDMPRIGTFNLHASLLPQYRGAAPINRAIINGDDKTGVTTFFLRQEIDTGEIIFQEEIPINESDDAGVLHDRLMFKGAGLVLKTVEAIILNNYPQINQNDLHSSDNKLKLAPKIFKKDCMINWNSDIHSIYNLIRGLSPYPAAWSELKNSMKRNVQLKIFKSEEEIINHSYSVGTIISDSKNHLKVSVKNGFIVITDLQQAGKKRMKIKDFLKGFQNITEYSF